MASSRPIINASAADFSGNEARYVADCVARRWVTHGPYVERFEEGMAQFTGRRYAIACSSGTAALHLAMLACGVDERCTVIVPAMTYVATANAARYVRAKIEFADINADDWCIDYEWASKNIGCDDWAVPLPVHMYDARACDFSTWDHSVRIMDSAHSPEPSRRRGAELPPLVDVHSFFASKVIACGEGGMLVTDSDDVARQARLFRGQGALVPGRYLHAVVGYNYRMTEMQAALGLAQLERISDILRRRRAVIDLYRQLLAPHPEITLQGGERASGWCMAVLVPPYIDRDATQAALRTAGIETRPFFQPLPTLPMYDQGYGQKNYPVAKEVARRGVCLPTHTLLTAEDIEYVIDRLVRCTREAL